MLTVRVRVLGLLSAVAMSLLGFCYYSAGYSGLLGEANPAFRNSAVRAFRQIEKEVLEPTLKQLGTPDFVPDHARLHLSTVRILSGLSVRDLAAVAVQCRHQRYLSNNVADYIIGDVFKACVEAIASSTAGRQAALELDRIEASVQSNLPFPVSCKNDYLSCIRNAKTKCLEG